MNSMIEAGRSAEDEARWHLDRCIGKSKNWKVFHDLTFQDHRSNSPCQIDHVLIGRLGDVIVMETKSAVNGMQLDVKTGAWSAVYNGQLKPIRSPVEQNKRHIDVLKHQFKENAVYPKRLGLPLRPTFHSWILIQPGVSLPLIYDKAWIVQRDQIERRFDEFIDKIGFVDVLSMMGVNELEAIGKFLERYCSKPTTVKTPVATPEPERIAPGNGSKGRVCGACGVPIESNVAAFCRYNAKRFGGQYLCRKCQTFAPK